MIPTKCTIITRLHDRASGAVVTAPSNIMIFAVTDLPSSDLVSFPTISISGLIGTIFLLETCGHPIHLSWMQNRSFGLTCPTLICSNEFGLLHVLCGYASVLLHELEIWQAFIPIWTSGEVTLMQRDDANEVGAEVFTDQGSTLEAGHRLLISWQRVQETDSCHF